jgi:hypothetical protein
VEEGHQSRVRDRRLLHRPEEASVLNPLASTLAARPKR